MSEILPEIDEFTEDVVVPEDFVDLRNAESVVNPFSALTNRTYHLKTHAAFGPTPAVSVAERLVLWDGTTGRLTKVGAIGVDGDGELVYATGKPRTIVVSASSFRPDTGSAWVWVPNPVGADGGYWQIPANDAGGAFLVGEIRGLKVGMVITSFDVIIESNEGAGRSIGCRVLRKAFAASWADGTDVGGGAAAASSGGGILIGSRNMVSSPHTVLASNRYFIRAFKGSPSGAGATYDRIGDVRINVTDFGPRSA